MCRIRAGRAAWHYSITISAYPGCVCVCASGWQKWWRTLKQILKRLRCVDGNASCRQQFNTKARKRQPSTSGGHTLTSMHCGRFKPTTLKREFWPYGSWCVRQPSVILLAQGFVARAYRDHPVSKSVYDFLGYLPVLPGPCGLYRYDDLKNGRYQEYFELVKTPAATCGILLANLKIAEDRIPSLFAVFFTEEMRRKWMEEGDADVKIENVGFKTHWVRNAVFYYEPELTLESLVKQRRRWLNGTQCD